MIKKERIEVKENVRGGNGKVYFYHILETEQLYGHGTMYARVVLPSGSSIGLHQHIGNTEPYYILSGRGLYTDADGSENIVGPGDCCTIVPGESHAIANPYAEDLVFMALIYNE